MSAKQQFRLKLLDIHKAYSIYIDKVVEIDEAIAPLRFKFNLILNLIEDLYHGTLEDQASAKDILTKLDLQKVTKTLRLPDNLLEKLIYSPESYAQTIQYEEEIEDDLFI